jgi:hypothetical protein
VTSRRLVLPLTRFTLSLLHIFLWPHIPVLDAIRARLKRDRFRSSSKKEEVFGYFLYTQKYKQQWGKSVETRSLVHRSERVQSHNYSMKTKHPRTNNDPEFEIALPILYPGTAGFSEGPEKDGLTVSKKHSPHRTLESKTQLS